LRLEADAKANGTNFCNYTLEINGILNDQSSYYMQGVNAIYDSIQLKAQEISQAITLNANATINAPLQTYFANTVFVKATLSSSMTTVVVFLGLLSF